MKILLVRPHNKFTFSIVPPLSLGYLSAVLKTEGKHSVSIYDASRDRISSLGHFERYLTEYNPHVVGIQLYSVDLLVVRDYLRLIKRHNPGIITVLGGPHPSALPGETMDYFGPELLDFVIAGEGELSFLALVNQLQQGSKFWSKVPGLAWRGEDREVFINRSEVIEDLDSLPWPDWELLDPPKYSHSPLGGFSRNFPTTPVLISRGCMMRCNFCAAKAIYGQGVRFRNIDNVISEISYLRERFGVKEITVLDDNITYRKDVFLQFCEKIRPLAIDWNCNNGVRLNFIDDEIAMAMQKSGCYSVGAGVESGSQRILNDMDKDLTIESIKEKINILAKHKILITGFFIIGYPTETREDIVKTIQFAKSLKIDQASFVNFIPLPGSLIYNKLKEEGRLQGVDFGNLSYYKATHSFSPHLSNQEVNLLLKRGVRSFYLRPLVIFRALRRIGSVSNLLSLVKRFIRNYTI